MFGGDGGGTNDNAAAQPADGQQVAPANDAMTDLPTPSMPNDSTPPTDTYTPESTSSQGVVGEAAATTTPSAPTMSPMSDDLVDIKQQALQQLSPLVGHLDQTPEEKFRTTMMMIQASDNADLIKEAFTAAQQISDEKVRAQALLDVVNEINYFTQHQESQAQ